MLVSIEPARAGVDLHTFECAVCNHALETLAAYDDPMKSKGLERWLQGDLHPPKYGAPGAYSAERMANDARDPHDAGRMGRLDARTVG
jgi:hypothetical protein